MVPLPAYRQHHVVYFKELLETGALRPVIDRRYPLAEVPDALRDLQSGRPAGKLVIEISDRTP